MINNTNVNATTRSMAAVAAEAYEHKLADDIKTITETLDLEFRTYAYPISTGWILRMAEYLKKYKLLTGKDYEIKIVEDTIV